ncbi:MAG: metallophosphoesterase [Halothece sp. Uz-M2-17]|nr:metallophosphoesterase [Halothece sp. Uz-M2-17]
MSSVRFFVLLLATILVTVTASAERIEGQETPNLLLTKAVENLYNPPRQDVRLVVMSDLNTVYGATDYPPSVDKGIALIPFWQPDLVICGGDMVAGQKSDLTETEIKAMWDAFDDHVARPLREQNLPFGFTIGNHDGSGARDRNGNFHFQQERDLAFQYWNHPTHDPSLELIDRADFPFYYTFKHKDIFFLVWDGSTSNIPAEKLAWVETALTTPAAQQAKMRILLGHLPLYAVAEGRNKPGEVMNNPDILRGMLEKYDVHTYISGHHHAYYPGYRGELELLHTGVLGAGPRRLLNSDLSPQKTITVVDIDFDSPEKTTYTTYDIQTLDVIAEEQLPRRIEGHNGFVIRRDLK